MDTTMGLIDAYPLRSKKAENFKKIDSTVCFCDCAFIKDYNGIVQRITAPIDIRTCGSEKWYRINAIWDTGAMISCISRSMVQKLKLQPVEEGVGVSATGQTEILYYFLDVNLSDKIKFCEMKVAGFPMNRHDADFLIGMDIISKGNLSIDNSNGKTKVTFEIN